MTPNEPGTLDPEIPVIPNPDNPGDNTRPGAGNSILTVSETDLGVKAIPVPVLYADHSSGWRGQYSY